MDYMPKAPNTIQFSLSNEYLMKLKDLANNGESLGLVAKRLLVESLGGTTDKSIGNEQLDRLESRLSAIEAKLSIDSTIDNSIDNDTSKPLVENFHSTQYLVALQNKFCVVSLNGEKKIEKFWSGRDWSEDLSKAKIFESERGVTASVKNLKGKYKNVAFNSCDRLYEMLSESDKAIAALYWIKENE